MAEAVAAVAEGAEVVGTTDGGRGAQDRKIPVGGGKGPPWTLRYK
jgi:hypothetical protein